MAALIDINDTVATTPETAHTKVDARMIGMPCLLLAHRITSLCSVLFMAAATAKQGAAAAR